MRKVASLGDTLLSKDFFCIDELEGKNEEFYARPPFFLSMGKASFVVKKVDLAIRQVRKGYAT